jgi:hypothetical protein
MKIYGKFDKNGKIVISNPVQYENWVKNQNPGDDVLIEYQLLKDRKTLQQLKLIHHCLREISSVTGYTVDEVKILMKMKYGICFIYKIDNKDVTHCKSLGDLSKKELSNFIIWINDWAGENLNLKLLSYDDIQFIKET